jgi:hypothetical protein
MCFTVKKIVLTGTLHPTEVLGIASDVYNIIVTTLDALREKMHPLEYTACVVLSSSPDGMTHQEFEKELTNFLVSGKGKDLPWYVGCTSGLLQDALAALQVKDGFTKLMDLLRKNDWLLEQEGKVKFKPRNFTWGVSTG